MPSAPAPVRDPWQEGDGAFGTAATAPGVGRGAVGPVGGALAADEPEQHDPHEVTVQLDAVQLGDGVLRRAAGGPVSADAADRPVFVDESGRRSRLYRRIGIAVGLACAVYAVVMVVTLLSGNSDAPWLPVPGQEDGAPAGKVDTTPLPTGSVDPSVTGSPSPQTTPSATGVEEQLPTADASATDTVPAAGQTATETDPGPTVTDTAPAQDGDETEPDPTDTATEPAAGSPDPTPTDTGGTTPDPTATTGGDSAGTGLGSGTLAQAPGTSSPRSPLVEYTY
ncbi:hypothetical protein J7I94_22885 [Streptomyces sp. ISL-12]|nr:hypothetical protein [Streptomyces sp. ISL-12]